MKTTTTLDITNTFRQIHTTQTQAYLHLLSEYLTCPRRYAVFMTDDCLDTAFFIPEFRQKEDKCFIKPFIGEFHKVMSLFTFYQRQYPRLELRLEQVIDLDEHSFIAYIHSNYSINHIRLLFEFDKMNHKIKKINTFHLNYQIA